MKKFIMAGILALCFPLGLFAQVNITAMEYFIDTDNGVGSGIPILITPATTVNAAINIPTASLSVGVHYLYVRSLDANGVWSMTEARPFSIYVPPVLPPIPNLNGMEYFIDADPGEGNGTPISIGTSTVESASITINTTALSPGLHYLHIRALESNGNWGIPEARPFSVASNVNNGRLITQLEYYFDTDPGLTSGIQIAINPAVALLNLDTLVNTSSLSLGNHDIGVRTLDEQGNWSFTETFNFDVCDGPNPGFQTAISCAGDNIQFIDQSAEVTGGETYRWDLDGDSVFDVITPGNPAFTYAAAGSYTVHLQIEPPSGCIANLFQPFEIYVPPVPSFSFPTVCLGTPTTISDQSTNLTSTATYSWDFDNDGTIDNTTAGNVPFTSTTSGNFNTSLTITNGFGCERTITQSATVFDPPIPNFSSQSACLGTPTTLSDLSTNLTSVATYNWDFNGDGIIDETTTGDVSFASAVAGNFNVSLNIINSTGCEGINSQIVTVLDQPLPNFTSQSVCLGSPTTLSDLSTNLTSVATYNWDFNGDGIIDETTTGDVSFTSATAGNFNVSLNIINSTGCEGASSQTVTVFDQPAAPLVQNSEGVQSDPITLIGSGAPEGNYLWYLDQTDPSPISGEVNSAFVVNGLSATQSYYVSIIDINGCESQRVEITAIINPLLAKPNLNIYNIVTPRPNGKHDFLKIENIEFYPLNEVKVYNRWGDPVFEMTAYNNVDLIFTGIDNSGNELPDGTYYYVVDTGEGERSQGFFILRN